MKRSALLPPMAEAVLRASAWPSASAWAPAQERVVAVILDELAAAAGALTKPELAAMRVGEMLARSAHSGPV